MTGLGTIANVAAILLGGVAGLALGRHLPRRLADASMQAIGLAVVVIGLNGALGASFTVADGPGITH